MPGALHLLTDECDRCTSLGLTHREVALEHLASDDGSSSDGSSSDANGSEEMEIIRAQAEMKELCAYLETLDDESSSDGSSSDANGSEEMEIIRAQAEMKQLCALSAPSLPPKRCQVNILRAAVLDTRHGLSSTHMAAEETARVAAVEATAEEAAEVNILPPALLDTRRGLSSTHMASAKRAVEEVDCYAHFYDLWILSACLTTD